MKFLADENIDQEIVEKVRLEGHEVFAVAEVEPGLSAKSKADIVVVALKNYGDGLNNNFSVISPTSVRIRPSK